MSPNPIHFELFYFLLLLLTIHLNESFSENVNPIPTYCVDQKIIDIIDHRVNCTQTNSIGNEVKYLYEHTASEFFRSHELLAYEYYMHPQNPNRKYSLTDCEFEFFPLLPLDWIQSPSIECSYSSLISDMKKIDEYITLRDETLTRIPIKFTVMSSYNLRTRLGTGLSTHQRKSPEWNTISHFIQSLSIGHYERWPECPDLLRRPFQYNIEIPYLSITYGQYLNQTNRFSSVILSKKDSSIDKQSNLSGRTRRRKFLFIGNLYIEGPDIVCSVRNEMINLAHREDLHVYNLSHRSEFSGVNPYIQELIATSQFCLITKGDSYSSSFFYHALSLGCIPIVINDWFVFSFPWIVPYEKFVIRVMENDFLKDPDVVLDTISKRLMDCKGMQDQSFCHESQLDSVRQEMIHLYRSYLSYEPQYPAYSEEHLSILQRDKHFNKLVAETFRGSNPTGFASIVPFDLMLLERRYFEKKNEFYSNIPCIGPNHCGYGQNNKGKSLNDTIKTMFYPHVLMNLTAPLQDLDYQVNPLMLEDIEDKRSHFCKNNKRLIGHNKIVFFMQCVRVLWPVKPCNFKPIDKQMEPQHRRFVYNFHNIGRQKNWSLFNFPIQNVHWEDIKPL